MVPKILVSADLKARAEEIKKLLSESDITNPHADLLYFEAESKLGIEQSRKVKEHLSFKPIQAKGRVVVLENASSLTTDAQNALLKILEEPPQEALIILGVNSEADLLPTVISRCHIIQIQGGEQRVEDSLEQDIKKLLSSDIPARFEYIEKLQNKEKFLGAMIIFFRQQLFSHEASHPLWLKQFLAELLQAEEWLNHNVNARGILEYLMLKMPKISISDKLPISSDLSVI